MQLQEAAAKATASAAAYEAAFSATIPPPVVYANRAQLAALVATNILGQNTPAIAANEAMYGEFWAQDATALTTYAANAAAAAQVTPLTEPTQNTNPGGTGAQAAAVSNAVNSNASNSGLNGLLSSLQSTSSSAATPAASAARPRRWTGLYNAVQGFFGVGAVQDTINTINVTRSWCMFMVMRRPSRCCRTSLPVLRSASRWATPPRWAQVWASARRWRARRSGGGGATLAGMGSACRGRRDVGAGRLVCGRPGGSRR